MGAGGQQAECEQVVHHCSSKGKLAPGLHLQRAASKDRNVKTLLYPIFVRCAWSTVSISGPEFKKGAERRSK